MIKKEFEETIKGGMVSAGILKTINSFNKFTVSTVRNTLSKLKKENYLVIGFRRKGQFTPSGFERGVCYYKLK